MPNSKATPQLQSSAFCLSLLNYFSTTKKEWGVRELAGVLERNPAVVHRALTALVNAGLLQQDPVSSRYQLGIGCIALGHVANANLNFQQQMIQALATTSQQCEHSLFFYQKTQHHAHCVYVEQKNQPLQLMATLGHKIHLTEAPFSQIILAFSSDSEIQHSLKALPEAAQDYLLTMLGQYKTQGYAYSKEVMFKGTHGIAVPVFNLQQQTVGALCIAAPIQQTHEDLLHYKDFLIQGAQQIQAIF